jgi:hypothetical protein
MVEVPQELHLTQSPQTEHGVVKRRDLLDGHFLARWLVQCGAVRQSVLVMTAGVYQQSSPNDTVCTLAHHVLDIILLGYVEGDLSRATAPRGCAGHGDGWRGFDAQMRVEMSMELVLGIQSSRVERACLRCR